MNYETIFNCDGCGKKLVADLGEVPQGLCLDCHEDNPSKRREQTMSDNLATIAAQQMRIDELLAQLKQEREFGEWLETEHVKLDGNIWDHGPDYHEAITVVRHKYLECKQRIEPATEGSETR